GGVFLANTLPLGVPGTLVSGGMLPLINLAVGLEVAAGLTLLLSEFLEQTLVLGNTGGPR
ncbi:MAG TPA: sodium:proton antiporter, partial [Actinomycetes bacterium]|nr:sodium:proton antiporter [Actinomycetes bacterium]